MLWVVDELMTLKASAEHTGGAYSLTDSVVPSGGGPPPHVHHRVGEDEPTILGDTRGCGSLGRLQHTNAQVHHHGEGAQLRLL